jgi:hypothetical protein
MSNSATYEVDRNRSFLGGEAEVFLNMDVGSALSIAFHFPLYGQGYNQITIAQMAGCPLDKHGWRIFYNHYITVPRSQSMVAGIG